MKRQGWNVAGVVVIGAALGGPGTPEAAAQCDGREWTPVMPEPRSRHSAAFDSWRGKTVMFGGTSGAAARPEFTARDTWEWDGEAWVLRFLGGPSERVGSEMAFDAARGQAVLFGGTPDYQNTWGIDETWSWDGTSWALRSTDGPSGRVWHAMVYDSRRERVVLFGGLSNSLMQDTWEWDGWTWTRVATDGPAARRSHAMAYDPVRGVTVLFGGMDAEHELADTWEWDGVRWTERRLSGPSVRYDHAMAFAGSVEKVILYGGTTGTTPIGQTWVLDGAGWTQLDAGNPGARERSTLVGDTRTGDVLMVGGGNPAVQANLWRFRDGVWTQEMEHPRTRSFGAGALDVKRGRIVMGGSAYPSSGRFETWEWDGRRWHEVRVPGPSQRSYHVMAYDSAREVVRLYGGASSGAYRGDHWEWDGAQWTSLNTVGPPGRSSAGFSYDAARDRMVVTGGIGYPNVHQDTWEFDGVSWMRHEAPNRLARWQLGQAYDPVRQRTVLVGGFDGASRYAETWEWDGQSWSWVASDEDPVHPSARSYARLGFDPHSQKIMLLGGSAGGNTYYNDTWLWDGDRWEQAATLGPPNWRVEFLQPDPLTGNMMAYVDDNLWEWKPQETPRLEADQREITLRVGASGVISVRGSGTLPMTLRWERDGVALSDNERRRGTESSSLHIRPMRRDDAGTYVAIATSACGGWTSSQPIVVRVVCPADFDQDGEVSSADLLGFVEAFVRGEAAADFDGSGATDSRDFFEFLEEWFGVCE